MKQLLLSLFAFLLFAGSSFGQEAQKVNLTAYVADNCGVPHNSETILQNKLNSLITSSGFGNEANSRFIMTAKVDILSEDITPTTPAMYAYTLSFNLYIGDGFDGTLFATTSVQAKGVGNTKDKAYMQALKSISPRDPSLKAFVEEGKQKVIDYYVINCPSILKRAEMLASSQEFDEAIWELSAIPNVCEDCYNKANNLIVKIYKLKIEDEGKRLLAEAQGIWASAQDRDAAERASAVLAMINPSCSSFQGAQKLYNTIAARVKQLDNREWNFMLKQQQDEVSLQKSAINAARDVAVAYAKNQPKTIYNIVWW